MILISKKLLLLSFILLFTACSTNPLQSYFSKERTSIDFNDIAKDLTIPLCQKINTNTTLYISDFVNESNLKNKSKLGFLLSNQVKANTLSPSCPSPIYIQDLQLAKTFKISKNGSRILSRNIKELKNTVLLDDKQILVGSYILTSKQIIVFLKLINLKYGSIIASSTTSRPITDEIRSLEGLITNKDIMRKEEVNIYKPMHL